MDIIFVHEVRIDTLIGVYEWERQAPQTLQLDLEIGLPQTVACQTDNINDTIDYGKVVERLRQTLAEQHFLLLEALAEHIAQLILSEFGAPWVRISVAKIGLLRGVKRVGVCIERGKRL
ncbi:dihydroneopterin aldolase [Chitinivorax tropicus]|uniref:7,8-dihydroneopterin aldolase n=1 Tax=Chitinivorax tropicus TaxID=714531 RepID=A0A840MTA9_9PROT|nr:dihydroneopterin aldolase [Chitinivorax tropicus]MBB5019503.1 dihydroneopterin aldolase [Chitinivorax tropicus]